MTVKVTKVDSRYPDALRFKGAVIKTIFPVVCFHTAFAAMLVCLYLYAERDLTLNSLVVTILSTTVSLLISFRTNSAYDRFWEARKLWSQLVFSTRNLSRNLWILVSESKAAEHNRFCEERQLKRMAGGMLVAFSYATKDLLMDSKQSIDKIYHLLGHIPAINDQLNRRGVKRAGVEGYQRRYQLYVNADPETRRRRYSSAGLSQPPKTPNVLQRIMAWFTITFAPQWLFRGSTSTQTIRRKNRNPPVNIASTIALHLSAYITYLDQKALIEPSMTGNLQTDVNNLLFALAGLERIQTTPIPLAYSIHLHQLTWLYLLVLPFQLVKSFKWVAVPVIAMASFTLFGILAIGEQIENPFNGDENDLPLTMYCELIEHELNGITSVPFAFQSKHWVPIKRLISEHKENEANNGDEDTEQSDDAASISSQTRKPTGPPRRGGGNPMQSNNQE
ncbi:hypothetical protein H4R35_005498 [Dimargaris xerosporica]|nr:hypothetical protein H4R35_005498 [Dimargaris xerosporica]